MTALAAQSPSLSCLARAFSAFLSSVANTFVKMPVASNSATRATVRSVGVGPSTRAERSRFLISSRGTGSRVGWWRIPHTALRSSVSTPRCISAASRRSFSPDEIGFKVIGLIRFLTF